jgi:hypothetical protein
MTEQVNVVPMNPGVGNMQYPKKERRKEYWSKKKTLKLFFEPLTTGDVRWQVVK